jgi:hypothetical protein
MYLLSLVTNLLKTLKPLAGLIAVLGGLNGSALVIFSKGLILSLNAQYVIFGASVIWLFCFVLNAINR